MRARPRLAALLAALAPSLGASELGDLAASMAPGTWAELQTQDIDAVLAANGASGNDIGYSEDIVWDPVSRQLFFVGGDHNDLSQFNSYSEATNTWQVRPRPAWMGDSTMHGYDHSAIDPGRGLVYHRPFASNDVHRYDIANDAWTTLPEAPNNGTSCCDALEYFPPLDGLVWVHHSYGEVLLFKESTQQWTPIDALPPGSTWNMAEYNPVHHVLVFAYADQMYRLSSTGQVTPLGTLQVPIYDGSGFNGVFSVDPVSGDYIVATPTVRTFHSYDAVTGIWQPLANQPAVDLDQKMLVATPLATYGVTLFTYCDIGTPCGVLLYKHAPLPSLSVDDVVVTEGDAGTTASAFTVTLSAASSQAVSVGYSTADGTATAGIDYQSASGTLSFAPGAVSGVVSVSVLGDTAVETDEGFVLDLGNPVGATLLDAQGVGTISDDDAPSLSQRELVHGSEVRDDLGGQAGLAGEDAFRLSQAARASYEVVLDAMSGDVVPGVLERLAADNVTVLQSGVPVGGGNSLSLRWENVTGSAVTNQHVRVRGLGCGSGCGSGDVYRVRSWETTYGGARFNNSASQVTVLVLHNAGTSPLGGRVSFWSASGTLLSAHPFTLSGREGLVVNTATLPGLAGQGGSLTVSHDGGYGALSGKAVALEPATGFTFDTALTARPR